MCVYLCIVTKFVKWDVCFETDKSTAFEQAIVYISVLR